ncbi:hypothetical protein L4D09_12755 [Photobacterium makurazakiensis]|uniref:hypothetical protein n=1 Tax=Photobacterium makurazakiensis TaxID=2910234 RepID=UPI003D13D75D
MKKVIQFKKVLSGIDIITNILIGLIALAGVVTMAEVSPMAGLSFLVSAGLFWVFKVLALGISYTLIQIAENTMPNGSGSEVNITDNVIETDLEKQFSTLYESNKGSDKVTDSMHRIHKKLQNGDKVKEIYLETAIEQLKS